MSSEGCVGASKIVSPVECGDRVYTDQRHSARLPLLQPLGTWFRHSPGLKILKNLLLPTPHLPPSLKHPWTQHRACWVPGTVPRTPPLVLLSLLPDCLLHSLSAQESPGLGAVYLHPILPFPFPFPRSRLGRRHLPSIRLHSHCLTSSAAPENLLISSKWPGVGGGGGFLN